MYRKPLTNTWLINVGDFEQISFTPTPGATVEECAGQFMKVLGRGEIVVAEEIDNLRLRTPDNIYAAMQRLARAGEPAVEPLIQALRNLNEPGIFRSRVAGTLAMIGHPKAVEPLIEMLNDADAEVRWHAAKALADVGDERAIAPLERLAATDAGGFSIIETLYVTVSDAAREALRQIKARTA
jgi:HEAT repeat protein